MPIVAGYPLTIPILVPGIEGYHAWDSQLTLNDRAAWPRYQVDHIDGLHSLADPDDVREPLIGRRGEIPRPSFRRGKTVTYQGEVQGRSVAELRGGEGLLRRAFHDLEVERQMLVTWDPLYAPPAPYTLQSLRFTARPLTLEIPDEQSAPPTRKDYGFARSFALALRLGDPRLFVSQESGPFATAALTPQSGLSLPWTLPIEIPAPGSSTGQISLTVAGDTDTDPRIDVFGPATNPRLYNDTLGLSLITKNLSIAAGSWVRFDFGARTALLEGTSDVSAKIDIAQSTWWDEGAPGLQPGTNVIRLAGDSLADPARAEVRFNPATE